MALNIKKYNPGFLTDDELISSFCVRLPEFESIMDTLRDTGASSNSHTVVIGPRGSGKTHLLRRIAAEVRRETSLAGLFPVVFAEESYEVATTGEFWLECLGLLAEQAPAAERDDLRLSHNDLRSMPLEDDRALAERCLGSLLDFADRQGKRLLLIVENLNMLFAEMADPYMGWRLRKTLQTEPRIFLLGSATSRFAEIDHPDHALYDLFRVVTLRPLDTGECEALWSAVSGQPAGTQPVRPLQILTGGNPRLIAGFETAHSFRGLMDNLLDLVDEHTEYFKSHLDALPRQERRVYLALARLWKPATAREVAQLARVDVHKCSAQLNRLVDRGAVTIEGGTARRRQYYLTERMYNIYYLLRRPSGESQVIEALIRFMASYYAPADLVHTGIKGQVASRDGLTLSEAEVVDLLANPTFLRGNPVGPRSMQVLLEFMAGMDPSRALELIEDAPTRYALLPIEVALRNELGQETSVAQEIREVARDIGKSFVRFRAVQAARATSPPPSPGGSKQSS